MKKIILTAGAVVVLIIAGIQINRPEKNISNDQSKHLSTLYSVPDSVGAILTVACYDCHSNYTRYPWYADVQPVGWMLNDHIVEGKKELNFSEFAAYRTRRQFRKIEQIQELVRDRAMPLPSYQALHPDARLTNRQQEILLSWADATAKAMKTMHHPDSLAMRRR